MKKILSVALALVMILSCVSVMAFAIQDRAAVEISIAPVAGKYKKGDIVTFEVFYEGSEDATNIAGPTILGFGYDSRVFEMLEDCTQWKKVSDLKDPIFIYQGYLIADATVSEATSTVTSGKGATELDAAKGWDSWINFKINTQNEYQDYSEKTASFAFRLKIKEDADFTNGSLTIGVSDYIANVEDINLNEELGAISVNGMTVDDYGFMMPAIFSYVDGEVEVEGDTVESIIKQGGVQIRFRGVGEDADFSGYQNVFDVRAVAKISDADFKAAFGATDGEALKKIADIGFVFAPMSAGWDMNTAIALAQGDGEVDGNYSKKHCKYIQHTGDGADYIFTCIVTDIEDDENGVNRSNGFTSIAYAKDVDGNFYVFDEPAPAPYQGLFNQYFKG